MKRLVFFGLVVVLSVRLLAQVNIPDAPKFLSASVVPDSNPLSVELKWNPSDSLDVIGYIIYKVLDVTVQIDTVEGRLTDSYLYTQSTAGSDAERFRLAAFDVDTNKSMLTSPHKTILMSLQLDKCNNNVEVSWTPYEGWTEEVKEYKIYRRQSGQPYSPIGTVSKDKTSFNDLNTQTGNQYLYHVEAISINGIRATSNSKSIFTESYSPPAYLYAQSASVIDEKIALRFMVDNSAEVLEYRILKSLNPDANFQTIKSFINIGQNEIIYTDPDVRINEQQYYYKIISLNPCGVFSGESNIASNILLSLSESMNLYHSFIWTDYYQWQNGVANFRIYSSFDNTNSEIGFVNNETYNFSNSIEAYVNYCHDNELHLTNRFCYFVEAVENSTNNPSGIQGVSRSNTVCVLMKPVVWIPNAINTSAYYEKNRRFKPVLSFIEREPFELVIFDRWGFEVFRTDKTYKAWDGVMQYFIAPPQQYMYFLRYYDYGGKEYQQTGSFILYTE